jgi:uncharacterized OsmC-like protein
VSDQKLTYRVMARTMSPGVSRGTIAGKSAEVEFDTSAGQSEVLPGPADLLVTAFAACVLKNVERMSSMQGFDYSGASIDVVAEREVSPPRIARITYELTIETSEPPRKMELLHRNIARQGTIYNTLSRACEVTGEVMTVAPGTAQADVGVTTTSGRR